MEVFDAYVESFDAAVNAGDVDALMAGFGVDPASMPPDVPEVAGADALRAFWSELLAQGPTVDNVLQGFRVDGDLAVLWGSYSLTAGDVETVGKWISVSERQADGSWTTLRNMWNTDQPGAM
jgi:ketosteroid isomerase-like protein